MHVGKLQESIRKRDYSPEKKFGYFLKLTEEFGELAEVIRRDVRLGENGHTEIKGTINEELYDILYYVLALANVFDIDMEEAIQLKEALNRSRLDDQHEQ